MTLLSNHHDSSISKSPQAMPTIRLSSRDAMDKLRAMHDSLKDSKDLVESHVYDTKYPKDDEEGPKHAKRSFK